MARYDEEDLVFELLQLPHDLDCHGLKLIFEQVKALLVTTSKLPLNIRSSRASMKALGKLSDRSFVNLIAVRTLRCRMRDH